jgi:hypothetical protein
MLEHYDQLSDAHITGESVSAAEYNSLVRILDSQIAAALEGVGEGVVSGGLVVAGSGLAVTVAPLAAIARSLVGMVGLITTGPTTVQGLPANTTLYLYAAANIEEGGGEEDSRESGTVVFTTRSVGGEVAGAVLLAKVVTGGSGVSTVEDLRSYVTAVEALNAIGDFQAQVDAVETAVGSGYFGASPPTSSLDERVTALEGTGGGGGTGPYYWDGPGRSAGDPTTIPQFVDQEIAAAIEGQGGGDGGTITAPEAAWDVDSVNQAKALLDRTLPGAVEEAANQVDAVIIKWGVFGDGTNGTPDYVDREHSTWLP